jgi:hypothetical protein
MSELTIARSASPIQRNVVLTAGHCTCHDNLAQLQADPSLISFHLPRMVGGSLVDVGPSGNGIKALSFQRHANSDVCTEFPPTFPDPADAAWDNMILVLQQSLSVTELPTVPPVYTNSDFYDQLFNAPGSVLANAQLTGPTLAVGYDGSSIIPPVVQKQATIQTLNYTDGLVLNPLPFSMPMANGFLPPSVVAIPLAKMATQADQLLWDHPA